MKKEKLTKNTKYKSQRIDSTNKKDWQQRIMDKNPWLTSVKRLFE